MNSLKGLLEILELSSVNGAEHVLLGASLDSREIQPEFLFIACSGEQVDGRDYINDAIKRGASVVFKEADISQALPVFIKEVPVYAVAKLKQQAGYIAAYCYNYPAQALQLIGVTGTNGKTSTTHIIAQALTNLGTPCAVIGSLGNGFLKALVPTSNTTPDAVSLHRTLAQLRDQGAKAVAMEVSSHALEQNRVAGLVFDVAVFTNLTQDHLDYHHTLEAYFKAKTKLFAQACAAVINRDDPRGATLYAVLHERMPCYGFAVNRMSPAADLIVLNTVSALMSGSCYDVLQHENRAVFKTQLIGDFNASNLAAAFCVLQAMGISFEKAAQTLAKSEPVPGRMEQFGGGEKPWVIVDYAHTPDALLKVLQTLKSICDGHLYCVFGCGGNRDKDKRAKMAAVVEEYADGIMVTQDNPRFENPNDIVSDIKKGFASMESVMFENDRARAIASMLAKASSGDVVLIAGKGREEYQIIGNDKHAYSDVDVIRALGF